MNNPASIIRLGVPLFKKWSYFLKQSGEMDMAKEFEVTIDTGEILKGWHWPCDDAVVNLTIITGMNEYAMRYDGFARWMNDHSVNVWCLDAFGQGRNAESEHLLERWPERGFEKNVDAIYKMIRLASENGLPTYHMGHSMGSFMTQSLLERYPDCAKGIILCGSNGGQSGLMNTGFQLSRILVRDSNWYKENRALQSLGMGGFAKAVRNRETDYDWLSYNKENVRSYIEDPWCGHFNTGGFWKEFMRGMSRIWQNREMEKISRKERILIISGEDDPVGRMGKGPVWLWKKYRSLGLNGTILRLYPRMRHEILNEDGKETVYKDILRFIRPGFY